MKRFLSVLLVLVIALSFSRAIPDRAQAAETAFEGYTAISSKDDLNAIRNNLQGKYYLTKDIIFTEADYLDGGKFYNEGKGWEPIGTEKDPFKGILEGNGHAIIGLRTSQYDYAGMFAYLSGTVKNLTMKDVSVEGNWRSGAIAGSTEEAATISNCTVYGSVVTVGSKYRPAAGGFVGICAGDINTEEVVQFENCHNYATVTTCSENSYAGGIYGWGYIRYVMVYRSSNHGNITGEDRVGGIAGQTGYYSHTIECYNTGTVIAKAGTNQFNLAGGIAGVADGWSSNTTKIINCYNAGTVKAITSSSGTLSGYVGGIAGAFHELTVENCYNVGDLMHNDSYGWNSQWIHISGIGSDLTTATDQVFIQNYTIEPYYTSSFYGSSSNKSAEEMQNAETYQGFDFSDVWFIDARTGYPYPQLRSNVQVTIDSITVETQPTSAAFVEGRKPDLSGATAKITYKSGETAIMNVSEKMLLDIDYCKPGQQSVRIQYAGVTSQDTIDFQIISKNVELTAAPEKLVYLEGKDPLDITGAQLTVTYGDGTYEVIPVTEDMVCGFDNTKTGPQTLKIQYEEKTVDLDIEIKAKSLIEIRVSTLPLKLNYVLGQPLDIDGGILELIYDNDTVEKKALAVAQLSYDKTSVGQVPVEVSYGDIKTQFTINMAPRVIVSIVVTAPQKVSYYTADALDISGCELAVYFQSEDEYSETVPVSADMLSGYDMNTPGEQSVVVTYKEFSTSFTITVLPNNVESIEIRSLPTKLRYQMGVDDLDISGGMVNATYSNGSVSQIAMSEATVTGFDNTVAGTQTLTVTYDGKTASFDVEIVERQPVSITMLTNPKQTEYLQMQETLDLSGGSFRVEYSIGESVDFPLTAADVSGFDNSIIGEQTLVVIYEGVSTSFTVMVVTDNTTEFAGGAGTAAHPYLISTKEHLNNVRNHLNASFRMLNDIIISDEDYLEGGMFYNNGNGWKPLGESNSFKGVFDGNGFAVENLYIKLDCANVKSVGLFAVNEGTIQNLTVRSGSISVTEETNRISAGAIVGTNKGIVENCHNMIPVYVLSTTFSSRVARAGGIVGYNYSYNKTVIVTGCSNSGDISAYAVDDHAYSGGIIGESFAEEQYTYDNSTILITDCYNSGTIRSGASYTYSGGIVGENGQNYAENIYVRNCCNTGHVIAGLTYKSGGTAGGIVGFNGGYISECYNTADVTAYLTDSFNSAYAGGIAGSNRSPNQNAVNTIADCYNSGNITAIKKASWGNYAYAGGITGCQSFATDNPGKTIRCYSLGVVTSGGDEFGPITSAVNGGTVENCYHLDNMQSAFETERACSQSEMMQMETFEGFDFATVWTMGGDANYPYPELQETPLKETVESIEIVNLPSKLKYYANEKTLDLTGGEISILYNTTRTEIKNISAEMVSGFDNSKVGTQTLTIRIDNAEATFEIEVVLATVIFVNDDGEILSSQQYSIGDSIIVPPTPTKASDNTYTYAFAGWDKAVVDCAGDATYTATYKSTYIDYVVKFVDEDGTVISEKGYHWGDKVAVPVDPIKEADDTHSYTFAGWDKEVVNCIGDTTYTATYCATRTAYTVVYHLNNITSDGADLAKVGSDYTATLRVDEGYLLPQTINITVSGILIADYSYNSTTGSLTIPVETINGSIVISASAVCTHASYVDGFCACCGKPAPAPDKPYKITNVVSGVHVYWKATEDAVKYGLWRSETGANGKYKWIANPTVPHFTDTKVESGKTYYYKVTAMYATGNHSNKSDPIGIAFVSTPDITSRVNKAAGITLGWDKIEGATGYAIYRKSYVGNDAWARVGTVEGNSTFNWTDASVKNNNGTAYKYTIRALAGSNMKTLSGCRNAGRSMVRLASRTLTGAAKASETSIKCSWNTSSAVTGYEIRFMVDGIVYKILTVGNYKTGIKTFTGLQAGQTYKIQVRSYKKIDGMGFYSAWSEAKYVTLPENVPPINEADMYTKYLLNGGYEELVSKEADIASMEISSCLADIDEDGIKELLLTARKSQFGTAVTHSALLDIVNGNVSIMLQAHNLGGTMGGDSLRFRKDSRTNKHVLEFYQYMRDAKYMGKGCSYIYSITSNTYNVALSFESLWLYTGADSFDDYILQAQQIMSETDLYVKDGEYLNTYMIDGEYVSADEYYAAEARFAEPDEAYTLKTVTYTNPIP